MGFQGNPFESKGKVLPCAADRRGEAGAYWYGHGRVDVVTTPVFPVLLQSKSNKKHKKQHQLAQKSLHVNGNNNNNNNNNEDPDDPDWDVQGRPFTVKISPIMGR